MRASTRPALVACCAVLMLFAAEARGEQVELVLKDGTRVHGDATESGSGQVTLREVRYTASGFMRFVRSYPREQIAERIDLDAEYRRRLITHDRGSAEEGSLATWCLKKDRREEAITHAREALVIDPGNEQGRSVLLTAGFARVDGKWLPEADFLAGGGMVRDGIDILTVADKRALDDARKASTQADRAAEKARDRVTSLDATVRTLEQSLEDSRRDVARLEAAQITQGVLDAARRRADTAKKVVAKANAPVRVGRRTVRRGPDSQQLAEQQAAQDAYQELLGLRQMMQQSVTTRKAQQGVLSRSLAKARVDVETARAAAAVADSGRVRLNEEYRRVRTGIKPVDPYGQGDLRARLPGGGR